MVVINICICLLWYIYLTWMVYFTIAFTFECFIIFCWGLKRWNKVLRDLQTVFLISPLFVVCTFSLLSTKIKIYGRTEICKGNCKRTHLKISLYHSDTSAGNFCSLSLPGHYGAIPQAGTFQLSLVRPSVLNPGTTKYRAGPCC